MDTLANLAVVLVLSGILTLLAYRLKLLTKDGSIASFFVGVFVGSLGSVWWLLLLILFTLMGFVATLMGLSKKKERGLQEGKHGERGYKNVLGVAIPCCIFAIANFVTSGEWYTIMSIAYISTISVAAADTVASELGVKDQDVWLITTFKRVPPGTDGGISKRGTALAFLGGAVVSLIGWLMVFHSFSALLAIPIVCGFVGCNLDSVVGATIENKVRGINKYTNNCITGIAGGLISVLITLLII